MRWYTCTPKDYRGDSAFFARDSGLLSRGFQSIGIESRAVLPGQPRPDDEPDLIRTDYHNLSSAEWWKSHQIDGVVLYSWALPEYNSIAKAIHDAGIFLILNQDSAGILFPVVGFKGGIQARKTSYFIKHGVVLGLFHLIVWFAYRCSLGFLKLEFKRLKHLSYGNLISAVTPLAAIRYRQYVSRMGAASLAQRVVLIPHPVASYFCHATDIPKQDRVIAVGRWDDLSQKRPDLLREVIGLMLQRDPSVCFDIIGIQTDAMNTWHAQLPQSQRTRTKLHGIVANHQLVELYQRASILLSTSAHESFHIPAAEALCCGCSVVSPRLDSLPNFEWFTSEGHGRLSESEDAQAIADCVEQELQSWRNGHHDPSSISRYWTSHLHAECVAQSIIVTSGMKHETSPTAASRHS